ncbi:cytochrome P450 [Ktedonosporobacter rubrisoli]|uniref:Cytochrome P450 n=1 Tax=Ktedonosporobacter rubrisoli TaxID=2509675 RepID=A0A4P6K267_KTERU|nr:cytochrome P450 [Ktedonosporobacter rubrisoli]QBD82219.1 cytochrome P450 [Ktedonosporobacter rubrisoli]
MLQTLSTLEDAKNLYAWFQEMRDTQPVWLDEESGSWHVFRYADVHTIITDYNLFSSALRHSTPARSAAPSGASEQRPSWQFHNILTMDPPQHQQYRGLVSSVFTLRALDRMRGRIAEITQELLDKVRPAGKVDLVESIAYPLPAIIIAELLGVPASDRPHFKRWADALFSEQLRNSEPNRSANNQGNDAKRQGLARVLGEMFAYFKGLLEERKRAPRDDMMSDLLAAEVNGEHLSIEDTISFCNLLLLAGHVTTTSLLSQAIRCFDEHPEALARLRKEPELMPGAVEEVLRYASLFWRVERVTRAPVTIAGVTIPEDATVLTWLASANRDSEQFSEPEHFDITRKPNRHIAFGHGVHFCLGAPLARMEASIALSMIIEQLPGLHVVRQEPAPLLGGHTLFGFKRLSVEFTSSELSV